MRDRSGAPAARQPLRVVVGTRPLPAGARLLDGTAPVLVLDTHDPAAVLDALPARGIHHVLLEGGATLAAAFLRAGLVDEVVTYVAPALLGRDLPPSPTWGGSIDGALRLETTDVTVLDGDVRITTRPRRRS